MRILMTVHHPLEKSSGASGSMWQLAQHYRELGHEVEIICFDDLPTRWPEQFKMLLFPWIVARKIRQSLRRGAIDIIDAHSGDSWVWSRFGRPFSARGRQTTLIVRSTGLEHADHEERLAERQAGKLRLSRLYFIYHGGLRLREVAVSLRLADGCIFLNSADRDYATRNLGVAPQKTGIYGNGIPAAFAELPLENLEKEPPRIAVVGTFSSRKGIDYSVPALQKLLETHSALEIGFFGTGAAPEQVLSHFSASVRPRISVVATFSHEDLPILLRPYRFQLLASLSEGFGKVLLEAMARGLACVTTDAPGPLEIARDGENALVVPRRDSEAIVHAFERLFADAELTEKLRRNAQKTARNHTWNAVARARLGFYAQIRAARQK